jgi:hypothetical protein
MVPLSSVLFLMFTGAAGTAGHTCAPAKPDARVHVSFLADSDLGALVKWAKATTCIDYSFEAALAGRRLGQAVILTVTGRDLGGILDILLHSMNLRTYGRGNRRTIVADGAESAESRATNDEQRVEHDREKVLANLAAEIKRKDEGHYTISRRGLDVMLGSMPILARSMRVVPEVKDGKPVGIRLFGLKPEGPLAHLGMQNGDLVQSFNGSPLTTPAEALAAYNHLRTTGELRTGVLRRGKSLSVEIRVE